MRGLAFVVCALLAGCGQDAPPPAPHAGGDQPTNRLDVPAAVRQNLGITFARVVPREVARTVRVPGSFELEPTARREYRAAASGHVELLVSQYQRVASGDVLYRLDAPAWRDLQRELTDAQAGVTLAQAESDSIRPFMQAHEAHHVELQKAVDLWTQRVESLARLREAGGGNADAAAEAAASLASARADLAETLEKEAELAARELEVAARLAAARARAGVLLAAAATLSGVPAAELVAVDGDRPRWLSIDAIEVRARAAGVVEGVEAVSGGFVEQSATVLTAVQPERVRFRAEGLQSDLGRFAEGGAAAVVPPRGGSLDGAAPVPAVLALSPTADPERRTIGLVATPRGDLPAWVRPGVSAFLEVVVAGTGQPELAIPLAAVIRDGLHPVIFRRDPANPDRVIRIDADLGIDDGRWVVVRSGVREGDEVVVDGVYQLMLASSASAARGGHFHSDGTFHEGEDK